MYCQQGALDWTTRTRLSASTIFDVQTSEVFRASLFVLVLGREGSSWDEMDMRFVDVKVAN